MKKITEIKNKLSGSLSSKIIGLYLICMTNPVFANLDSTARNFGKKAQTLGKAIIFVAIIGAGYYYLTGSPQAKEKATQVAFGAFFILAAKSIVSWASSSIR